jgi:hypothetical protein
MSVRKVEVELWNVEDVRSETDPWWPGPLSKS